MFNLVFGVVFIITNFLMVLGVYKLFGRLGVFMWIAVATILCNIQVIKTIDLFSIGDFVFSAQLGNTMYGSIFLATDILSEKYGEKDANQSVWIGFASAIISLIAMQMALLFIPSSQDLFHPALVEVFSLFPRTVIGSLIAYLVSQFLDVYLFHRIKERFPKQLWFRNDGATIVSQMVDSVIFTTIAFLGVYSASLFLTIMVTNFVLKMVIAFLDTPFIYWAARIKPNEY